MRLQYSYHDHFGGGYSTKLPNVSAWHKGDAELPAVWVRRCSPSNLESPPAQLYCLWTAPSWQRHLNLNKVANDAEHADEAFVTPGNLEEYQPGATRANVFGALKKRLSHGSLLRSTLNDPRQHRSKHRLLIFPVAISEAIFIGVFLQMFWCDMMIRTVDTSL